jgi:hypothetical protein
MIKPYKIINGIQTYISRRGYGNGVIYSWIHIKDRNGEFKTLGDPWKAVNPPINQIKECLKY